MAQEIDRRSFLKGAAAMSGLLAARPFAALAGTPLVGGAPRGSTFTPGLTLVHTDLHNHSVISGDADGDPYTALSQMGARGIDVACLTEHAISGKDHGQFTCSQHQKGGCRIFMGINEDDWATMRKIADDAYDPGRFVSFRAFEWSTPTIGHLNVWFSERYTDALHTNAFFTPRAIAEVDRVAPVPSEIVDLFEDAPEIATMSQFYEWLASPPDRPVLGGGNDGIACFNHPNEFGNFEAFRFEPSVAARVVSCEALNADRDFFWHGADEGMPNPLDACLNAGWRIGFTGVSDEHGTVYGRDGMARGGLWVTDLTREAVRAALVARRSFASFEPGLRLDAVANGVPMGGQVAPSASTRVHLDIAGVTRPLLVEVIAPGPTLVSTVPITVPAQGAVFELDVELGSAAWAFLRITDPARPPHPLASEPYRSHGGVLAYASPWFVRA